MGQLVRHGELQKTQFSFYQMPLGEFSGQVRVRSGQLEAVLKLTADWLFLHLHFQTTAARNDRERRDTQEEQLAKSDCVLKLLRELSEVAPLTSSVSKLSADCGFLTRLSSVLSRLSSLDSAPSMVPLQPARFSQQHPQKSGHTSQHLL